MTNYINQEINKCHSVCKTGMNLKFETIMGLVSSGFEIDNYVLPLESISAITAQK